MDINLLISCQTHLFAEGLKKLLEEDRGLTIVGACCGKPDPWEIRQLDVNLIVTDPATFHEMLGADPEENPTNILVISDRPYMSASHNDLQEMISKGLVGILPNNTDVKQLRKAIQAVTSGELWLDRKTIKNSFCSNDDFLRRNILFTKKEGKVLKCLLSGYTNKEIAQKLFISEQTVKSHLNRLYKKFGVSNRVKLVISAYEMYSENFIN